MMTRNGHKHRHDPPGPFLARSWSAGAPRRQRRSCSLRCACSTLTPPTHRQGSPGSRNDPARPGVKPPRDLRPPTPQQPDQDDEEAAAGGAICVTTTSSNGSHNPRSHARCSRDFRGSKSDHGPEVGWVLSSGARRSDDQGFVVLTRTTRDARKGPMALEGLGPFGDGVEQDR
jgi:hypothetical protein